MSPAGRRRAAGRWSRTSTTATPALLLAPALLAVGLLLLPLVALLVKAPWSAMPRLLREPVVGQALRLSLLTATVSTAISLLLGVPLAWVLARTTSRAVGLLRSLVVLPLVLPPVVGGVALLLAFGRRGLLGAPLHSATGLTLPFSTAGVVLAETFVAMPFLVVTVEGALRSVGTALDEAAATLGASRLRTLRRVTLPVVAPSLLAGAALCWARALGEFGATVTFAGSFPGRTQTVPLAVAIALESDPEAAVALSVVLLVVSVAVLLALRGRWVSLGRVPR